MSFSSRDLPPRELALDDERRRLTTPRKDVRLSVLFERDSSLLLLLDIGRGDSNPLEVEGLDSDDSGAGFFFREIVRRIQDGDNRSFEGGGCVDMMSSDIWKRVEKGFKAGSYIV